MRLSSARRAAVVLALTIVAALPTPLAAQTDDEPCPAASPVTTGSPIASPATGTPTAAVQERRVTIADAAARLWGGGNDAVLLIHGAAYDAASWRPQAAAMAEAGYVVLALEEIATDDIQAGIAFLTERCGATGVTVIGASAGGTAALQALAANPAGVTGLILLSASGDVANLGDYPKLFVASEGEGMAGTVQALPAEAPGDRNQTLILPGDAHAQAIFDTDHGQVLLEAIIAFLGAEIEV